MNELVNCDHCNNLFSVILDYGIHWACPVCGGVMDVSGQIAKNRHLSEQTRNVAAAIGAIAVTVGLVMLLKKLDRVLV
jgi:PHP family Zn ribbon phosphoesterase